MALKFYVPYSPKDDSPDTDAKASSEKPQTAGADQKVLKKTVGGSVVRGTSWSAPFKAMFSALLDWVAGIARGSTDQEELTKANHDKCNKTSNSDGSM